MKTERWWGPIIFAGLLLIAVAGNAMSSSAPLTAAELLAHPWLTDHREEIRNGDIVVLKQPEKEAANQLNVSMVLLVPAPLQSTVDNLQRQATATDTPGVLATGAIDTVDPVELDRRLAAAGFDPQETEEVARMLADDPWDRFNFSRDETALLRQRAETLRGANPAGPAAVEAMSAVMREVLKGRYLAYRRDGLDGVAPYRSGSDEPIDPSAELKAATEALDLVKSRFPHVYGCLRFYPQQQPAGLVHQFYWAKQTEAGRPLFLLKHWVLDVQPDYALIAERRFYLSHSLNSLQVVIGCLPHGDGTLVVLLNQAFTEKVNMTVGRSIAKTIGYRQVEKNIRPIFENLRSALGR